MAIYSFVILRERSDRNISVLYYFRDISLALNMTNAVVIASERSERGNPLELLVAHF